MPLFLRFSEWKPLPGVSRTRRICHARIDRFQEYSRLLSPVRFTGRCLSGRLDSHQGLVKISMTMDRFSILWRLQGVLQGTIRSLLFKECIEQAFVLRNCCEGSCFLYHSSLDL